MGAFCSRISPNEREENDTMSKPYRQRTSAEWEELIRKCKSSGLSDYEWCRRNEVPQSSFYRNLKKFHGTTITETAKECPAGNVPAVQQEVVPLKLIGESEVPKPMVSCKSDPVPAARLQVNGMTIDLFSNADPSFISGILKAVSSIC